MSFSDQMWRKKVQLPGVLRTKLVAALGGDGQAEIVDLPTVFGALETIAVDAPNLPKRLTAVLRQRAAFKRFQA